MRSGVALIILAMSLTPALDGVAKELGRDHAPILICFSRYLSAGLIALAIAAALREPVRLHAADLPGQFLRAGLMMGAMTAFIAALAIVPLADAVGGFLVAPIVSTCLSILFLGERLTREKTVGSLLSLLGAVIILQPGAGLSQGSLLAIGGGVLLGCYFAAARGTGHGEGVISALAVQSLLGSAMIAPFALGGGLPEIDVTFLGWALALGLLSAATHMLTILAFRMTEATVLAPFMYFNIIAAVAVGFLWFREVPTSMTLLGLGAILAGGLLTAVDPHRVGLAARFRIQPWPFAAPAARPVRLRA
jgi:drug/metabolite transporter (DMT)-like permease